MNISESSVLQLCQHLGRAAVVGLNSSVLKDNNPQLYFVLKDAAVILANVSTRPKE